MDSFEYHRASHASSSESSLVPEGTKASSAGTIQLQFTHDNPSNTIVMDMTGQTIYIVKTTHDPVTVTVLTKMLGSRSFSPDEELFYLEWRDVRSDKISVRGNRPVDFSAILSPCLPLSSSRKFTFDGKRYRWADIMGEPRLYLQGNKVPLAQFNKSWPEIPPNIQARLKNPLPPRPASISISPEVLSTPGLLDMIFITFLPMLKSVRIFTAASKNTQQGIPYAGTI